MSFYPNLYNKFYYSKITQKALDKRLLKHNTSIKKLEQRFGDN